ncbi:MAG: DUF3787 domain-containing protein [Clostridiales bacterium]|jgi:hypothetical protein|nr:DUF3787 domain-containing protein [Clostridiales bacterium]
MTVKKIDNLQGRNNKRLKAIDPTNSEGTAAWQNSEESYKVDMVNKPSIQNVIDAKDWVDNGSKL